jgi:hypothetical protein
MEQTQTVLVIMLAIGFGILLLMTIALVFILIKILTHIRRLTARVDETTENLSEVLKYTGRKIGPAAISAIGGFLWNRTKKKVTRKDK